MSKIEEAILEIRPTCVSCDACRIICPEHAVFTDGSLYTIDTFSCTMCNLCVQVCPIDCIKETTQTAHETPRNKAHLVK